MEGRRGNALLAIAASVAARVAVPVHPAERGQTRNIGFFYPLSGEAGYTTGMVGRWMCASPIGLASEAAHRCPR